MIRDFILWVFYFYNVVSHKRFASKVIGKHDLKLNLERKPLKTNFEQVLNAYIAAAQ